MAHFQSHNSRYRFRNLSLHKPSKIYVALLAEKKVLPNDKFNELMCPPRKTNQYSIHFLD